MNNDVIELSDSDDNITSEDLLKDSSFIGEIPFEVIAEGISQQFMDYIQLNDRTNYVSIFYDQLEKSYQAAEEEDEEHPEEKFEILGKIHSQFISNMISLIHSKLAIHIPDEYDTEIDYIIDVIYEAFILSGHDVFLNIISKDILLKLEQTELVNEDIIRPMLDDYSPIVLNISPMKFLSYLGNEQLNEYYKNGQITGNFLRRYTPKLYQNKELESEIISTIIMKKQVKEELYAAAKSNITN